MEDQLPQVSVLMPNYNGKRYVQKAIESILKQSYRNFEFVIVDDCSTDGSWEIINQYAKLDQRIVPVRNERNIGVAATLNHGLRFCKGKWVARMDSDDISEPNRLKIQLSRLKEEQGDVCACDIKIIDDSDEVRAERIYSNKNIGNSILIESPVAHPTVIMRRELLGEETPYDLDFESAEDYDLWLRLYAKGAKFIVLPQTLYLYRLHLGQVKSKNTKKQLRTTLRVKSNAIKKYKLPLSFKARWRMLLERILIALPADYIVRIFNYFKYKRVR